MGSGDKLQDVECMAIDWLEWEVKNTGQHIRHKGNDSEKFIGMKRLPVDGLCRHTNTVYEFQGVWSSVMVTKPSHGRFRLLIKRLNSGSLLIMASHWHSHISTTL
jgi:hypothetical protein